MTELGKNLQQNTTLREFNASGNDLKDVSGPTPCKGDYGKILNLFATLGGMHEDLG